MQSHDTALATTTMTPPPIQSTHHIALLVTDLARCEHFYGEVLGLPVLRRWLKDNESEERSIWFDLGQGAFLAVELTRDPHLTPECKARNSGWHLLAIGIPLSTREVWREHLRRAGYPCTHETLHTLYCRDPEGNSVGLSHWPQPATP